MPEKAATTMTLRFDQMAVLVNDRIDNPSEANVDRYVGLEHLDSESLKIRRWGKTTDVEATKLLFKAGDIIFGRRRVYQRKLAVADFDGICSAHAMVLRAKPEVVLPELLPFFMQSDMFMERALEISVGSLSPTINWKTLAKDEFILPSLEEQRRIAEVMQAAEAVIQSFKRLLHVAEVTKDASTFRVFPNNFNSGSRGLAAGNSDGWNNLNLKDIVVHKGLVRGPFGGSLKKEIFVDEGYMVYEQSHAISGDLSSGRYFITEEKYREMERFQVSADDLIMSCSGTIGKFAMIKPDNPKGIINQALLKIRPDPRKVEPKYLAVYLNSKLFAHTLTRLSMGSAMSNVTSVRQIEKIDIPIPPRALQKKIVSIFDNMDAAIMCIAQRITSVKRLSNQIANEYIGVTK